MVVEAPAAEMTSRRIENHVEGRPKTIRPCPAAVAASLTEPRGAMVESLARGMRAASQGRSRRARAKPRATAR